MQEIIEIIEKKIVTENSKGMTNEHQNYIRGLSDALQIIKEHYSEQLIIGEEYYVISNIDKQPKVEYMTLYRINNKKKCTYCFTRNSQNPTPDVVLSSKKGLRLRVFNDYESAKNGIPIFLLSLLDKGG